MKYLFLDTSSACLNFGIVSDNELTFSKSVELNNELSIYALSHIEEGFKACSANVNDVDIIMVVTGPGSFTGVRIGVTIAKTIAWTLNKKIIPISSLKAQALSADNNDYIVSIIDARRECFYAGIYNSEYNDIITEQYINSCNLIKELDKLEGSYKLISNANFTFNDVAVTKVDLNILKIVQYFKNSEGVNPHEIAPNYLKNTEAEENLDKK